MPNIPCGALSVSGCAIISFTPDAELKERINKPFSAFETVVITEEQSAELSDVEITKEELPTVESDNEEPVRIEEETESVETESVA